MTPKGVEHLNTNWTSRACVYGETFHDAERR